MGLARITLGELQSRLEERVGQNSSFWDAAEGRNAINEAICLWQGLVGEWAKSVNLTCDGSSFYEIPHQLPAMFRVGYVSSLTSTAAPTPLTNTSLWELDHGFSAWTATTGTPSLWARLGGTRLAVYPQASAGYLVLYGFSEAPTLDVSGNYIDLGDEELVRLLDYAQFYMAFKEGVGEGTDNSDRLLQSFLKAGALRNRRILASNIYRHYMGEARDVKQRPGQWPPQAEDA